ncbi:MAG: alpha/beta hydrolase [Cytophagaceae bacterium]|nr:MAG: alpha/beta hydrolase [Cytophagaceae bacterium]
MKRRLLLLGSLVFIASNVVAFLHAWRFTHFTDEPGVHSPNPEQLSPSHKLWVLLTGVQNPKPQNRLTPSFAVEDVAIPSPNGTLAAWYARPDVGAPKGTVALFHGYTGSKAHLLHEAGYFRRLGYAVLLVDQTGNGNSAGSRTTVGYREAYDVAAAVHYLRTQRRAASPDSLVLYGVSMGAVAIMRAEAELGVRASVNILECPYGTMRQTVYNRFHSMRVPAFPLADMLVFWGGVQNGFWAYSLQGEAFARRIKTRTLLLWGTADPRVTRAETDAIFANLAGPKQRVDFEDSEHEPYWLKHPQRWQQAVAAFLAAH